MYPTRLYRLAAGIIRIALFVSLLGLGVFALPTWPAGAAGVTVSVDRLGSGLQFHAASPQAVDWEIQLSTSSIEFTPFPPHFRTGGSLPARVKRLSSNGFTQTRFDPTQFQLAPDQVYNYIVRGGPSYVTGAVRTFQSRVTVAFNSIQVSDDSDDLGAGELTFHFDAGDGFFQQFGEVAVSSGSAAPIPTGRGEIRGVTFNKLGTLRVMVEAVDDDYDPPFEACRIAQLPDGTSGSDNCFDWATATFSTNVAQFAGLSQNFTSRAVTFQTTGFRLKFAVVATVTVEYGDKFAS